jgi:hypothetical protein
MNKLTLEGLAAGVANTAAALPAVDWNEQPAETPNELHERLRQYFTTAGITFEYTWSGGGRVYVVDGEYYTPSGAEAHFLAPKPRTGRANWGPQDRVEYRPRWKTDHHPWAVIGPSGEPNAIRYANSEVDAD